MALSDGLTKLATRAKEAEDRFAAAQQEAHAKLEHEVESTRASVDRRTSQLNETAEANRGKVAGWWNEVQQSWDEQIASIQRDFEAKKTEHDRHDAERRAIGAEEDAEFAIQLAYWAVEQAEWAALDATLARTDGKSRAEAQA